MNLESKEQTIRVWDAETGAELLVFEGHTDWVASVAFSSDGMRVVSGSVDKMIRVWDAETGKIVLGPLEGHTNKVTSVGFSPDGRHIVSGSKDRTVRVWDAKTGAAVSGPLNGHTGQITCVAFSPDGRHIVSGSGDKTVRVWKFDSDAATAQQSNTFVLTQANSVDFKDSSQMDSSGWVLGEDTELLFWVPPLHRPNLLRPSNVWVGNGPHATRLDMSRFVHGTSWTECRRK